MNSNFNELYKNVTRLNIIAVVVAFASIMLYVVPGFSTLPFIKAGDWASTEFSTMGIKRLFIPGETLILFFSAFFLCSFKYKTNFKNYLNVIIFLIALYLPLTRTSWLAVLLTVFVFMYRELTITYKLKYLFVVIPVIILSLFVFSNQFQFILPARFETIIPDILAGENGNTSLASRYMEWNLAVPSIKDKPILGYGYGVPYRNYFYIIDSGAQFTPGSLDAATSHVHNAILNVIVAFGFVGLIFFALFIYKIMRLPSDPIGKLIFEVKEIKLYWYCLITILVAGMAGGLIVFIEVNMFILFILGMINSAYVLKLKEQRNIKNNVLVI